MALARSEPPRPTDLARSRWVVFSASGAGAGGGGGLSTIASATVDVGPTGLIGSGVGAAGRAGASINRGPGSVWSYDGQGSGEQRVNGHFGLAPGQVARNSWEWEKPWNSLAKTLTCLDWSGMRDLNPRPHAPHACALPLR